jgi:YfiH family protein
VRAPDVRRPGTDASFAPPAGARPGTSAAAPPARSGAATGTPAPAAAAPPRLVAETPAGEPTVPRAELAEWRERCGLVAGLTLRGENGGFSLGLATEEPVGQVMGRWRAFRHALAAGFPAAQLGRQVHSASVVWHEGVAAGLHLADDVDGHATAQRGLLLAVTIADCIPVYLAVGDGSACALLHAGWRGIAAGVLERGVGLLAARSGVEPRDLLVHLGVGICGDCYEVGPEVVRAVEGRAVARAVPLDLRDALAARAARLGIREVTRSVHCTSCSRDRFFSHRGSGGRDGRMVAYLGRPLDGTGGAA